MSEPKLLESLEIIGYGNRLDESSLPAIVPPLFRVKEDPGQILFPPFVLHGGAVCNATLKGQAELEWYDDKGEITLFENAIPAQPDFELWIDPEGNPVYERRADASANLTKLARKCLADARKALADGKLEEAAELARIACCSDPKLLDALAIAAALAKVQNKPGRRKLVEKFALRLSTPEGFQAMVDSYLKLLSPPEAGNRAAIRSSEPMKGMAALRPAELCAR
jgi:hypothetical protein